jgi:peptide deformylase
MSSRPIIVLPGTTLTTEASAIENINDDVYKLAADMAETMYEAPGLGLAANQVGELLQLIVIDVAYPYTEPHDRKKNPIFILNPKITMREGEVVKEEGCLSVPEFGVDVTRAQRVRVEGVDLEGNPVTIDAEDLLARVLQHEIDHLQGKTILDHASTLKRGLYQRRLRKKARRDR